MYGHSIASKVRAQILEEDMGIHLLQYIVLLHKTVSDTISHTTHLLDYQQVCITPCPYEGMINGELFYQLWDQHM